MTNTFKGVVKLSQTQYETLKSEGTISVGDVTLTYDPTTTLYVTPSSGGSGGGNNPIVSFSYFTPNISNVSYNESSGIDITGEGYYSDNLGGHTINSTTMSLPIIAGEGISITTGENNNQIIISSTGGGGTGSGLATESSSSDSSKSVLLTNSGGDYSFVQTTNSGYTTGIWTDMADGLASGDGGCFGLGTSSSTREQSIKFTTYAGLMFTSAQVVDSQSVGSSILMGNSGYGIQITTIGNNMPISLSSATTIELQGTALTYNSKNVVTEDGLPTSIDISGGV